MHHKLFACTVYTLNYDFCYTLHPDISFTVKFNGNMKHVTCMCVLLKWHKLKRQKTPSLQLIFFFFKTSFFFFLFFLFFQLLLLRVSSFSPRPVMLHHNKRSCRVHCYCPSSPHWYSRETKFAEQRHKGHEVKKYLREKQHLAK